MKVIFTVFIAIILTGCASSKISTIMAGQKTHPVKVIALMPGGGVLADAIGVGLSNRGFTLVDADSIARIIGRVNLDEFEITRPENLEKLRSQGIDAYLSVKSSGGYDQLPQSATARINSTDTGKIITGTIWQNGWGGMVGSLADRTMRKGLTESAQQIADALAKNLTQE